MEQEFYALIQTELAELAAKTHLYWVTYARIVVMTDGASEQVLSVVNTIGENHDFY